MQALGAWTVVFDDQDTDPGATRSLDNAAGIDLGLFLPDEAFSNREGQVSQN